VYDRTDGAWVNEDSEILPEHFSGRQIREGEALALTSDVAATILRIGYLYGPGRHGILESAATNDVTDREEDDVYHNFIHVADCVGVVRHAIRHRVDPPVLIAVDNEPTLRRDVISWLRARIAGSGYVAEGNGTLQRKPLRGNKRCSNTRLIDSGYELKYPTFRDGFSSLFSTADVYVRGRDL
jgi:nucleoside-diphosphate-sugar epimerase